MAITIYYSLVSPPARATLIVAEMLRLSVNRREINLPGREHFSTEFLAKNPLHRVPVLEDGELTISDSHAIITYLVSKYGVGVDEQLYPKDVAARAMVDQRLYFDATVLFPALASVIHGLVRYNEPLMDRQKNAIVECYDVAEKYLTVNRYIAADCLTVADVSCITTISSLDSIIRIDEKYEKLHGWWQRLKQCEWYSELNNPGLTMFSSFMKQFL